LCTGARGFALPEQAERDVHDGIFLPACLRRLPSSILDVDGRMLYLEDAAWAWRRRHDVPGGVDRQLPTAAESLA